MFTAAIKQAFMPSNLIIRESSACICLKKGLVPKTSEQLYKNYKLCSKEFEDSQFMNADQKKSLVHKAVPTIFDIPNPPPKVTIQRKLPIRCNQEKSKTKKQKGTYNGIFSNYII